MKIRQCVVIFMAVMRSLYQTERKENESIEITKSNTIFHFLEMSTGVVSIRML